MIDYTKVNGLTLDCKYPMNFDPNGLKIYIKSSKMFAYVARNPKFKADKQT